jgi:antirestriction protein ArdC
VTTKSLYETVTERMLVLLEAGTAPWSNPALGGGFPCNLVSRKAYRGINPFMLWATPYASKYWLSYRQAENLGGNVRKGEKGSKVVYWHWRTAEEMDRLRAKIANPAPCYPLISTVFNLEQCEGLTVPGDDAKTLNHAPLESAEAIYDNMPNKPTLQASPNGRAFYRPSEDAVYMPTLSRFETAESYYSTFFHELGHSTGHASRLGRLESQKNRSFGSEDYSFEELVAEMTAAFLCAETGITNQANSSASYLAGWIRVLKADNRIILDAATAAQKAVDYILGRTFEGVTNA